MSNFSTNNVVPFPGEKPDVTEMVLDGKPEIMMSARGVVLFHLSAWKGDGNEKAYNGLRRYCEYIAMHGYPGGTEKALKELDGMDRTRGNSWVKRTFAKYVNDQKALIQYVMS